MIGKFCFFPKMGEILFNIHENDIKKLENAGICKQFYLIDFILGGFLINQSLTFSQLSGDGRQSIFNKWFLRV